MKHTVPPNSYSIIFSRKNECFFKNESNYFLRRCTSISQFQKLVHFSRLLINHDNIDS